MKNRCIPFVFLSFLFVLFFWGFLSGQNILFGSDPAVSYSNLSFNEVLTLVGSGWKCVPLLGAPSRPSLTLTRILLVVLQDGVLWNNLYHGLACLFASFLLLKWLRSLGLSVCAALIAAVAAFWVGTNLTILYAAHPAKPYIVMLFVGSLIPVSKAARGSLLYGLLWGGCVGLMFVHQPDVAMFFALFSGIYILFSLWREKGFKPIMWSRVLVPALALALLIATGSLLSGYKTHVKSSVQTQEQTPQQKWDYVTQWSFPPEEAIAFIAPGYTGWRSGEPEGPYWGRMGRSAGWEQTKQGFQNFKLENTYLGIIPIAFALFALFSCRRSKHRAEILFWSGATLIALLLAFGKFFPLYSLFYKLPVVNNIRNPNKFLQVFQVCLAILTAYGFDALFSQTSKVESEKPEDRGQRTEVRNFFWLAVAGLGFFVLCTLSVLMNRTAGISEFMAQGWPQDAARVIVQNKITALWHASFMAAVVVAVFALFSFPRFGKLLHYKNWIAAALVLIVAADAVKLSKHYVKEMPRSYIEANALTDFLLRNLDNERVAFAQEQQIFGILKMYTFPYNKIPVFNPGDMSRMPMDYKNLLQALQRNPLALWEFSSVKYLVAPTAIERQVPSKRLRKVFSCNVRPDHKGGFYMQKNPQGAVSVFELPQRMPRFALFAGSKKLAEKPMLSQLDDFSQVYLSEDSVFPELHGEGLCGSVSIERFSRDNVRLIVRSDQDAILRCSDRYTSDWAATLDEKPVPVEPVDYICRGVFVPKGTHVVEIFNDAPRALFYAQLAGWGLFGLLMVVAMTKSWVGKRTLTQKEAGTTED